MVNMILLDSNNSQKITQEKKIEPFFFSCLGFFCLFFDLRAKNSVSNWQSRMSNTGSGRGFVVLKSYRKSHI